MLQNKKNKFFIIGGICLFIILSLTISLFILSQKEKEQITKKPFNPVLVNAQTGEQVLLTNTTKIRDINILGDNNYHEQVQQNDGTFVNLPEEPIAVGEVVLRYKSAEYPRDASVQIGGFTTKENTIFNDAELVYLSLLELNEYEVCGLSNTMSHKDVVDYLGTPVHEETVVLPNWHETGIDATITSMEYIVEHGDITYIICLSLRNDKIYHITVNIGDIPIDNTSDEEFEAYLKEEYGDNVIKNDYDPNSPDYPGYPPE